VNGIFGALRKRMKQSVGPTERRKLYSMRRPGSTCRLFVSSVYPFKLLRAVKKGLTTGRRMTKSGQLFSGNRSIGRYTRGDR
jgi:hypothetical protein